MTREVQSGRVGTPLFLPRSIAVVAKDCVQTGQPTNCMCPLRCVHVLEWVAIAFCALVFVLCYGLN